MCPQCGVQPHVQQYLLKVQLVTGLAVLSYGGLVLSLDGVLGVRFFNNLFSLARLSTWIYKHWSNANNLSFVTEFALLMGGGVFSSFPLSNYKWWKACDRLACIVSASCTFMSCASLYWCKVNYFNMLAFDKIESRIFKAPTWWRARCSVRIYVFKFSKVLSAMVFVFHFISTSLNALVLVKNRYHIDIIWRSVFLFIVKMHKSWNDFIFVKYGIYWSHWIINQSIHLFFFVIQVLFCNLSVFLVNTK